MKHVRSENAEADRSENPARTAARRCDRSPRPTSASPAPSCPSCMTSSTASAGSPTRTPRAVADVLNLSHAEVHGVVSFYADFRRTPPPAHRVRLCRAEACQSVGAQALYAATRARFGAGADIEVDEVFCLGNCALGPPARSTVACTAGCPTSGWRR